MSSNLSSLSSSSGSTWTSISSAESSIVPSFGAVARLTVSTESSRVVEGYDYEFVPPADGKYICPICWMVLRTPVQTACGHRFCRACIVRWIGMKNELAECPSCKEKILIDQLFTDNFANREIMNLSVRCPNTSVGCLACVELQRLQVHMENQCLFCLCPCPNRCTAILYRKDLQNHLDSECALRTTVCEFCHEKIPQLDRQMLNLHRNECPKSCVHCLLSPLGCLHVGERQDIPSHMSLPQASHIQQLASALLSLRHLVDTFAAQSGVGRNPVVEHHRSAASIEYEGSDDLESIAGYGGSLADLVRQRSEQELCCSIMTDPGFVSGSTNTVTSSVSRPLVSAKIATQLSSKEDESTRGNICLDEHGRDRINVRRTIEGRLQMDQTVGGSDPGLNLTSNEGLRRTVLDLRRTVNEQAERIESLERSLEDRLSRFCNGVYAWRIDGVLEKRFSPSSGAATSGSGTLHSDGFYTSPFGYRMCIRINLNGIESGFNKYIALFIHFLHGDYDDIVEWPFRGRITLSILDQTDDGAVAAAGSGCPGERKHIVESLDSKPDLLAFNRPTGSRNHKGFGYKEFAPIDILSDSRYVRNGTMIVRAMAKSYNGQ